MKIPDPVAYVDKDGFIVEIDEVLIAPGEKLYTEAQLREAYNQGLQDEKKAQDDWK